MSEDAVISERELVADVYEQIAKVPLDGQLRVLEFMWLSAASHARTAQLGTGGFVTERERQLASLERMADVVRADKSGL
jgi:hypothetical protein